jgi:hypothetical protein
LLPQSVIFHEIWKIVDRNLRRLLQRVAVRLQLHLDIAARRLRLGAMVCALATSASGCAWSFNSAFSVTSRKNPLSSLLRFTVAVTLMSLAFRAIFSRPAAALIALPKQARIAGPE